jgi:glycosyltransferase involved in cell wall biosynthesis
LTKIITLNKPDISVVIPIYNSANIFPELHKRLVRTLEPCVNKFEIIAVLDGCRDNSYEVISKLSIEDKRIKLIEFSRNFGHQAALTAGLSHASGELIAIIDDDLEDPPELLPQFIEKIREGFDVVYGIRRKRRRAFILRLLYKGFYRILGNLVDIKIPYDAGDFCVMTDRVLNVLVSMREHNRYLRGMRAWIGFNQTAIEYDREKRFADTSGYSSRKYIALAFNAIFSFSYKPLKYLTVLGFVISAVSFEEAFRIIFLKLTGRLPEVPGWAYLSVAVLFLFGIQFIAFGIMGEYIARIYDELKQRPQFVIKTKRGFDEGTGHGSGQ